MGSATAQRMAAADDADFSAQLVATIPHLRAFARSLCGDATMADDLAQEALAKAWGARDSYQPGSKFKAWIFMILRNHYFSQRRRQVRVADWDPDAAEQLLTTPAPQPGNIELAELSRAMQLLPDEQREALILIGAGGFSYEEVAEIAECAVGTIKSRVARARVALARLMEEGTGDRGQLASGSAATHEILGELDRRDPGRR